MLTHLRNLLKWFLAMSKVTYFIAQTDKPKAVKTYSEDVQRMKVNVLGRQILG